MIAVRAKPMNSPCSTTPGISDNVLPKQLGLGDGAERAVKDIVSPVSDERRRPSAQTDRPGEAKLAAARSICRRVDARPKGTTSTGSGKAPSSATSLVESAITDHPFRGGGDDLLAQQRAAAALDQSELGIDFVRPVDRQIELQKVVQRGDRNAEAPRLTLSRFGGGDASNGKTGLDPLPDEIDEMAGGRAGAEAEPHAGPHEFKRALGRLPLSPIAVRRCGHGPHWLLFAHVRPRPLVWGDDERRGTVRKHIRKEVSRGGVARG